MTSKLTRRDLILGLRARPAAQPPPPSAARLVAQIQPFDCLAQRGQVCSVCAERCPIEGAVRIEGTRVRIVASACTGCGVCQQVCPAPQNAIVLWPGAS